MALGNNDNIIIQNNVNLDAELKAELEKERAKVKELTDDVNRYIEQWQEASAEVEHLNEVIAQLESDSGVDVLKDRIHELTRATSIATEEFEGFLRYVHLIDEDGFMADDRLYAWFDAVKEGAITAGQAIANVKLEFGDFISETMSGNGAFDSQTVQQFAATLNNLSHVIDDIQARLIGMQDNGVTVAGGDGVGGTFSTIDQIRESVENMSEEAREAYQPITQLVEKIVELTSADSTKILAISQAFKGIAEFGKGSFGSSKINNIIDLVRQLHTITSSGNNVIRFELTGLNDLHVSKASMRNLAEYLPTIANVNAAELERLSKVNLTNFNDIKVSKVALESIAQLRGALDQLSDAGVVMLPPGTDAEMVEMLNRLSSIKELIKDINSENNRIQSSYSKTVGALGESPQDRDDYNTLTAKYDLYMKKLAELRQNKSSATAQDIQEMHAIQAEINDIIDRIQARMNVEKAASKSEKAAATERNREAAEETRNETNYLKMLKQVETLRKRIVKAQDNWTKSKSGKTAFEYSDLAKYNQALDELSARLSSGDITSEEFKQRYEQINAEFAKTSNTVHAAGEDVKTFGDRVKGLANKFGAWLSVSQVIMYAVRTVKKMVNTVKEIDTAITQLQIVTGATESEIKSFGDSVANTAQKIGASITDLVDSATTYARLGYSLDESSVLSEYTSMLKAVGNIDVSEAQEAVTSITKAFDIDASNISNVESVMDKLVITGNNFPISVSEIAEGMTNASSALSAAGNSFEQSVALLTAANTTVQNISKASTGLRTITARIRDTKTELDELGEDMTESKYEELVSALTNAGVALRDANGDYRTTYDIIKDIADVWDQMTNVEQAALTSAVAGTRMQNVFVSLVTQFKEASGAMDAMTNSTGALDTAYNTYLDSVQGRMSQFTATFQKLSESLVNSDVMKEIIHQGTNLLNLLTNLMTVGDGVILKVGAIVAGLGLLSAVLPNLVGWISTLTIKEFLAILAQEGFAAALAKTNVQGITGLLLAIPKLIFAIVGYIAVNTSGTASAYSFAAALETVKLSAGGAVAIIAALVIAIGALIGYFGVYKNSTAGLAETLSEDSREAQQLTSEINQLNSELQTTNDRIRELLAKDKLSFIEQDELNRLTRTSDELDRQLQLKQALQQAENSKVLSDFENVMKSWSGGSTDVGQEQDASTGKYDLNNALNWYEVWDDKSKNAESAEDLEHANKLREEELQRIRESISELQEYKKALDGIDYNSMSDDQKQYYDMIEYYEGRFYALTHGAGETLKFTLESGKWSDLKNAIDGTAKSGKDISQIIAEINEASELGSQKTNRWTEFLLNFSRTTKMPLNEAGALLIQYVTSLQEADEKIEDTAEKVQASQEAFDKLNNELSAARSAYSAVTSAAKEYNENGFLSSETLSKLLALEPEYLNLLVDENGQLNLNSESYETLIKSKLRNMLLNRMQSSFDHILSLTKEEAAAFAAGKAYDAETSSIYELLGAKMKLAMADAIKKDSEENTNVYTQAILREAQAYAPLVSAVEDYDIAAESASKTNESSTKTTNAQKKALEEQKKALEDSKKALEDYKNEVSDAQSAIKKLIDAVTDYIKQQKEDEKTVLEDRKKAFDDLIDKEKEELAAKKESAKFDEELAKKQNTVAKDALAASIASLDDSSAGRKAQKQANDTLAESRSDLMSTLSDHEYDIRVAALDKLKEKNDEYYDAETKKIDDYLANTRRLYEDACAMIENDTGDLYGKLWDYTYQHTTQTKAEFDYMWNSAQSALERYGMAQYGVIGVMELLQGAIYNTESKIKELDGEIENLSTIISNVSDSINNMANDSLSNVADKIGDIRKEYQDLLASLKEQMAPKWYIEINGKKYLSSFENQSDAINDILRQYTASVDFNHLNPRLVNSNTVKRYASGTSSAAGGLSLVGERGAELRVLNQGDGIIKNQVVRGITALGSNPAQFLAEAGQRLFSSLFKNNMKPAFEAVTGSGSMTPEINIVIQGDATQSTVNALKAQSQKIMNDTLRLVQSETLRRTHSSRVR